MRTLGMSGAPYTHVCYGHPPEGTSCHAGTATEALPSASLRFIVIRTLNERKCNPAGNLLFFMYVGSNVVSQNLVDETVMYQNIKL